MDTILKQTSGQSFIGELSRLKVFRLALSLSLSLITTKFSGFRLPCLFSWVPRPHSAHFTYWFSFSPHSTWEPVHRLTGIARTHEVGDHMQPKFKTKSETSSMWISHTGSYEFQSVTVVTIHTYFYYLRIGGVGLTVKLGKPWPPEIFLAEHL